MLFAGGFCLYIVLIRFSFKRQVRQAADYPVSYTHLNKQKEWAHHALGMFTNPIKRTSFEFEDGDGVTSADIDSEIKTAEDDLKFTMGL